MLASFVIQPYCKSKLTLHGVLPFPWDGNNNPEKEKKEEKPALTKEEAINRFEHLLERDEESTLTTNA